MQEWPVYRNDTVDSQLYTIEEIKPLPEIGSLDNSSVYKIFDKGKELNRIYNRELQPPEKQMAALFNKYLPFNKLDKYKNYKKKLNFSVNSTQIAWSHIKDEKDKWVLALSILYFISS